MAKGYSRRNLLRRIVMVQDEYMLRKGENEFMTLKYIYEVFIYPRFVISMATFQNYLATPARRDLKRMDEADRMQGRLFGDRDDVNAG